MAGHDALAFDDLVHHCALGVLTGILGWLCLAVVLTATTEAMRCTPSWAGRLARGITPGRVRRLVVGLCGVALAAPLAVGPASAAPPEHTDRRLPTGLPVPDRPVLEPAEPRHVRVATGDTLWAIAARQLPADASDAEIAATWPTWFRVNRARIG
ncbi:MAG: hypothetical protein M3211_12920, partial [Actinomycetota bacterium]|nr:hypothetical protein [Actinomycetota bacterium]